MGDSDEEFDGHRRHDKFTRERREYQGGSGRRRDDWMDDDRGGGWSSSGGHRGRDNYGRDTYGSYRRDRHSPGRGDPSPPAKRMRGRDWDNDRGDGHGNNWGQGGDRQQGRDSSSDNAPTQPPMMTFKQFLQRLDDTVTEEDSVKKFNEYKLDFKKKQLQEFFERHKDEEWFRVKYHPNDCDKRKEEALAAVQRRLDVFNDLLNSDWIKDVTVEVEHADKIIRLLDAAVIKLEGGTELDLQTLDERADDQPKVKEPELPLFVPEDPKPKPEAVAGKSDVQQPETGTEVKEQDADETPAEQQEVKMESSEDIKPVEVKLEPVEEIKPEPTEVVDATKAEATNGEVKDDVNGKEENITPVPTEPPPPPRPRALHKTASIFLRNLPPNIVKSEVEAVCKRYSGFKRLAIADPQSDRRFYRRGWVTFEKNVNIRDICWQLGGIKFNNTETGAIINRDLSRRIRSVNGIASHKNVVRADIRHAARIVYIMDKQKKLWSDPSSSEGTTGYEVSAGVPFSLESKNPLLHNITDYMIEEASAEEEELLGAEAGEIEDNDGGDSGPSLEKDDALSLVLDRLLLYLRIVHSVDYYNHTDYPQEDEMPNRIGIMHARGSPPSSKVTMKEVNEYIKNFETKIQPYLEPTVPLTDDEVSKLGKLDPEKEVDKFVQQNTKECGVGKYQCLLSSKKFKAPEFVKKHIINRYPAEIEAVRKGALYFNNYIRDPKRPQLPEHPSNRPPQPSQQNQQQSNNNNSRGNDLNPNMGGSRGGPWPPYGSMPLPGPYGFGPGLMPPRGPYGPGPMMPNWNGPPQNPFPMGAPGFAPSGSYSNRGRPSRYDPQMLPDYNDVDADLENAL